MSVWTVADKYLGKGDAALTLSEEAVSAGTNPKTLTWNSTDAPGLGGLYALPLEIVGVRMELTPTSATARRPKLQLQDSAGDVIFEVTASNTLTQASVLGTFDFGAGFGPTISTTELAGGIARCPLPLVLLLLPGQKLVATQDTVVDANDALVVHVRARLRRR